MTTATGSGSNPGTAPAGPGQVRTSLSLDITIGATLVLQVAVAGKRPGLVEDLSITRDGERIDATELAAPVGGRQHVVQAPAGRLEIVYRAVCPPAPPGPDALTVSHAERIEALRPSRYCPSDRTLGIASAEFAAAQSDADRMQAVCEYVARHTSYVSGSSGPSTDAVDTLLSGQGVCRDYAHLVAMLGRAAGIPTRLAAVYAPGLSPMDMHAVVEAAVDGEWRVWDATGLAPRHSLIRIATGRDAADTAFLTVLDGRADLAAMEITATVQGDLPLDDHRTLVTLGPRPTAPD